MPAFLLTAWNWMTGGFSWLKARPWAMWAAAIIGLAALDRMRIEAFKRQARERERYKVALEQETAKAETILRLRQLERDSHEKSIRAREAGVAAGRVSGPDELRELDEKTFDALFGPDLGDGSGDQK